MAPFSLCHSNIAAFQYLINAVHLVDMACSMVADDITGGMAVPINFDDPKNRFSYAGREADVSWMNEMSRILLPDGIRVVDVGCGGGIYSRAWLRLGASHVIGVDSSPVTVDAAKQQCSSFANLDFRVGDASSTGLADESIDVVFERALIHHIPDIASNLREAMRILVPGGKLIIQDRTPEDVRLAGSQEHIRGYIFECYPRLLQIEDSRRRTRDTVLHEMEDGGFRDVSSCSLWETRTTYPSVGELIAELRQRRGRSILHELADHEIEQLISFLVERIKQEGPIVEKDRWTIWYGTKCI